MKFKIYDTEYNVFRNGDYSIGAKTGEIRGIYGEKFPEMEALPLLFTTNSDLEIYDGDIIDIGQTVNGQSEFVVTQGKYGIEVHYNFDEFKIIGNVKTK